MAKSKDVVREQAERKKTRTAALMERTGQPDRASELEDAGLRSLTAFLPPGARGDEASSNLNSVGLRQARQFHGTTPTVRNRWPLGQLKPGQPSSGTGAK